MTPDRLVGVPVEHRGGTGGRWYGTGPRHTFSFSGEKELAGDPRDGQHPPPPTVASSEEDIIEWRDVHLWWGNRQRFSKIKCISFFIQ